MLGVVEHRQQHVQVVERVGEPDVAVQGEPDVAGVAPLRERSSSGTGAASTVQPSGAKSRSASSGPPPQGSAGSAISSGIGVAASSGCVAHRPARAVRKTSASATAAATTRRTAGR